MAKTKNDDDSPVYDLESLLQEDRRIFRKRGTVNGIRRWNFFGTEQSIARLVY